MRRLFFACVSAGAAFFSVPTAHAQNSIDALDQELNEAQQNHTDVSNKIISAYFAQVDAAMVSPDAAVTIYTDPAGLNQPVPAPAPVVTENEHESESEKEARLAIDQANLARLGAALQLHCGMLHYGGLFVIDPDRKGLQEAWAQWLKSAPPTYLQIAPPIDRTPPDPADSLSSNSAAADSSGDPGHGHKHRKKTDQDAASSYVPNDLKNKTLSDSVFTKFNNFSGFNGKDQGDWSVRRIPELYRANVLDPLRTKPSAETLAAWDAVIAMANADEPDNDKWNSDTYPGLRFDRACDAYLMAPSTEGLETLVNYIKQYPAHPKVDEWIARVHGFVKDYRTSHGLPAPGTATATSAPATAGAPSDPSVTTERQGDMTIITTHTNAPGGTPPQ